MREVKYYFFNELDGSVIVRDTALHAAMMHLTAKDIGDILSMATQKVHDTEPCPPPREDGPTLEGAHQALILLQNSSAQLRSMLLATDRRAQELDRVVCGQIRCSSGLRNDLDALTSKTRAVVEVLSGVCSRIDVVALRERLRGLFA